MEQFYEPHSLRLARWPRRHIGRHRFAGGLLLARRRRAAR